MAEIWPDLPQKGGLNTTGSLKAEGSIHATGQRRAWAAPPPVPSPEPPRAALGGPTGRLVGATAAAASRLQVPDLLPSGVSDGAIHCEGLEGPSTRREPPRVSDCTARRCSRKGVGVGVQPLGVVALARAASLLAVFHSSRWWTWSGASLPVEALSASSPLTRQGWCRLCFGVPGRTLCLLPPGCWRRLVHARPGPNNCPHTQIRLHKSRMMTLSTNRYAPTLCLVCTLPH